jgi:hypothetical protein
VRCCCCRHNFRYNSSKFAVNEDFIRVPGSMMPSLMSKIVIHHYQIKSLEVRNPFALQFVPCNLLWTRNRPEAANRKLL